MAWYINHKLSLGRYWNKRFPLVILHWYLFHPTLTLLKGSVIDGDIHTHTYTNGSISHKISESTPMEYSVLFDKKYENIELIFSCPYYPAKITKPVCDKNSLVIVFTVMLNKILSLFKSFWNLGRYGEEIKVKFIH